MQNTLRDLLGVLEDYRPMLPPDDRAHGFDKAAALNLSAAHLEGYLAVADGALAEVFAPEAKPPVTRKRHPQRWSVELSGEFMAENHRKFYRDLPDALVRFGDIEDFLVGFRGPPADGWYRFRVRARTFQSEQPVKARILAGFKYLGRGIPRTVTYTEFPREGGEVEITVYLSKGQTVRVASIGIADPGTDHRVPFGGGLTGEKYAGPGLAMEWVEAEGPLWDDWPRHRRVLGELDLAAATRADAERVLRGFLPCAFRRPVADAEVAHYLGLFDGARAKADLLTALKLSLKAALCSPHFVYLQAPAGPLDDHALAARLSHFLWSSMPDEELRALAGRGALNEPGTLRAQVERMLVAPKAAAFTEGDRFLLIGGLLSGRPV